MSIPPERDLPEGRLQLRKEHLVNEIVHQAAATRRRRRRLVLALVPAILLVLAATGFTAYVVTREPTHLESVGCFDRPSMDANVSIVSADGRDPAQICGELWEQGKVGEQQPPERLASCVLESGGIGVFPSTGADTCESLGLAKLPASYTANARKFAALRDALVARLGFGGSGSELPSGPCVGEEKARAIVEGELAARGFDGWRVETTGPFTAERPCAELAFEYGEETVLLVPGFPR